MKNSFRVLTSTSSHDHCLSLGLGLSAGGAEHAEVAAAVSDTQ